jgi:hypothetical protein
MRVASAETPAGLLVSGSIEGRSDLAAMVVPASYTAEKMSRLPGRLRIDAYDDDMATIAYDLWIARLRNEGSIYLSQSELPAPIAEFRSELRRAARASGMRLRTSGQDEQFLAWDPDYVVSDEQMRAAVASLSLPPSHTRPRHALGARGRKGGPHGGYAPLTAGRGSTTVGRSEVGTRADGKCGQCTVELVGEFEIRCGDSVVELRDPWRSDDGRRHDWVVDRPRQREYGDGKPGFTRDVAHLQDA